MFKMLLLFSSFIKIAITILFHKKKTFFCIFNSQVFILIPRIQNMNEIEDCNFSFSKYSGKTGLYNQFIHD